MDVALRSTLVPIAFLDSVVLKHYLCHLPLSMMCVHRHIALGHDAMYDPLSTFWAGARAACGDVLLFLHADCLLPQDWDLHVRNALGQQSTIAGAFSFDVHSDSGAADGLPLPVRMLRASTNFRSTTFQLPYGDQALFVSRSRFQSLGGFADLPLMEDYEFVTRLRRAALHTTLCGGREMRVCILSQAARCSIRRWRTKGVLSNTISNQLIVILYVFAWMSPKRLFAMYYGIRPQDARASSKAK